MISGIIYALIGNTNPHTKIYNYAKTDKITHYGDICIQIYTIEQTFYIWIDIYRYDTFESQSINIKYGNNNVEYENIIHLLETIELRICKRKISNTAIIETVKIKRGTDNYQNLFISGLPYGELIDFTKKTFQELIIPKYDNYIYAKNDVIECDYVNISNINFTFDNNENNNKFDSVYVDIGYVPKIETVNDINYRIRYPYYGNLCIELYKKHNSIILWIILFRDDIGSYAYFHILLKKPINIYDKLKNTIQYVLQEICSQYINNRIGSVNTYPVDIKIVDEENKLIDFNETNVDLLKINNYSKLYIPKTKYLYHGIFSNKIQLNTPCDLRNMDDLS